MSQTGPEVTARNEAWNGRLAIGAAASSGFLAIGGATPRPAQFRFNDRACAIR